MGVVIARLVFLAFLALTGTIIYNALYLQDQHGPATISASQSPKVIAGPSVPSLPSPSPARYAAPAAPLDPVETAKLPPASTDLPPPPPPSVEVEAPELLVKAVQRELATRGYDVGPADGKLNDKTRAAISAYEGHEGLPVTGKASDDLLRHILLGDSAAPAAATVSVEAGNDATAPAKAKADNANPSVKAVQQVLADLGYAPGPVDGAMGASTTHAIVAFQHDRKIRETGKITPELLRELKRVTGRDLAKTAATP
jgi:peptidoglycan hydrolase-like protein with peptidoglycan-binding domain